ncbi:MAG: DUF2017 domain-containing protein [Actinomycetota bacterium]|nr:DUF2017 domain-containing protein [Actinomycetota bacterium]
MKLHADGLGARLKFSGPEAAMLAGLLDELIAELLPDALDRADPVHERLFPSGYRDDADSERTFRELTETSLRDERTDRAEQCRAEVGVKRSVWRSCEVHLDAEGVERWMRVLNDMRLVLGTRLAIGDEVDYRLERGDPQLRERARYVWLTALQDSLVESLTEGT